MTKTFDRPPEMQIDPSKQYRAAIETSLGEIVFELFAERAPVTVNHFVFLAREGFYDGVPFHRVIPGFMIQGGDPEGTGRGGPGYTFEDEFSDDLRFDAPGLLAMANAGPATNGSQFFVTVSTPSHLNGRHTIFGRALEGYDVVETISGVPTDSADRPIDEVVMERIRIDES